MFGVPATWIFASSRANESWARLKPMVKNKRKILRECLGLGLNFIKFSGVANYWSYVSLSDSIATHVIGPHGHPSLLFSSTSVKQFVEYSLLLTFRIGARVQTINFVRLLDPADARTI